MMPSLQELRSQRDALTKRLRDAQTEAGTTLDVGRLMALAGEQSAGEIVLARLTTMIAEQERVEREALAAKERAARLVALEHATGPAVEAFLQLTEAVHKLSSVFDTNLASGPAWALHRLGPQLNSTAEALRMAGINVPR